MELNRRALMINALLAAGVKPIMGGETGFPFYAWFRGRMLKRGHKVIFPGHDLLALAVQHEAVRSALSVEEMLALRPETERLERKLQPSGCFLILTARSGNFGDSGAIVPQSVSELCDNFAARRDAIVRELAGLIENGMHKRERGLTISLPVCIDLTPFELGRLQHKHAGRLPYRTVGSVFLWRDVVCPRSTS